MEHHVELVWDAKCGTGESPVWDATRRRLLFCDIPAGRIHAHAVDTGAQESWQLPEVVGSFGLCRSGRLIVALRHRIVLFDTETSELTELAGPIDEPAASRFNDGKVGPDGCFWVGTMDESPARQPIGALYRVTPEGRIERKAEGYGTSNGLAWSADDGTMYHADTRAGAIDAWTFDKTSGGITERRRIATLSDEEGRPDGGATDLAGCYWSAGVSAGCLNRFSAEGKLVEKVELPVPTPTMPCFTDTHVYVTSLRAGRDEAALAKHPTMGGLFRLSAPVPGVPVYHFADLTGDA